MSLHGLAQRGGVVVRPVPPLADWPAALAKAQALGVDVIISALFLDRIPPALLQAFPNRVVNLHPALLPAYRGRWPTFNLLWDRQIHALGGISLHLVTPGFDAGAVLGQEAVAFPDSRNLSACYIGLVQAGTRLLATRLPGHLAGARDPRRAILASDLSWQQMEWLAATIPQMTPLRVPGLGPDLSVRRFLATLGPPTGTLPVRTGNVLALDARDARVTLDVG